VTARVVAALALATLGIVVAPSAALASECPSPSGGRVVLASDAVDPDVFLWDSRIRLVDYAAGQWGNTRAIFAHTLLAEPGTQAMVVSCVPAVAHPKYGPGDEDAIGVKILSGPHRGRYGWVLSSDTHLRTNAATPSSLGTPAAEARRDPEVKR
jgi:hypothetical protein